MRRNSLEYRAPFGSKGECAACRFAAHQDFSKALDKAGVKSTLISAGKYKTELSPFAPLGDSARKHVQSLVDDSYDLFVRSVARNRNVSATLVRNGMGQGRIVVAQNSSA